MIRLKVAGRKKNYHWNSMKIPPPDKEKLQLCEFLYFAKEIIHAERFDDVVTGSQLKSFFLAGRIIFGGDDDDRNGCKAGIVVEHLTEIEACQSRHHKVQRDQVGVDRTCYFKSMSAVIDRGGLMTIHAYQHFHQVRDRDIIVNNKYFRHECILHGLRINDKFSGAKITLQKSQPIMPMPARGPSGF